MAIDLLTGYKGEPHITSSNVGMFNAGVFGTGDYVLPRTWVGGNFDQTQFNITMQDSEHAVIGPGAAIMNGRQVVISADETVTIDPGEQGKNRNDLICIRYSRGTDNVETASLVCVKGTPTTGTPADPATYQNSSILNGAVTHDFPLYRIPVRGINVNTPVNLLPEGRGGLFYSLNYLTSIMPFPLTMDMFNRQGLATAGDRLTINGVMIPVNLSQSVSGPFQYYCCMSIEWWNEGAFHTNAWQTTDLAHFKGYTVDREYQQVCSDNTQWERIGHSFINVSGDRIGWQTPGEWDVDEKQWHKASMGFYMFRK